MMNFEMIKVEKKNIPPYETSSAVNKIEGWRETFWCKCMPSLKNGFCVKIVCFLCILSLHFFSRKVGRVQDTFETTEFFKDFLKTWNEVIAIERDGKQSNKAANIICLGLGQFAQNSNLSSQVASKYQLVFLLAWIKYLEKEGEYVIFGVDRASFSGLDSARLKPKKIVARAGKILTRSTPILHTALEN